MKSSGFATKRGQVGPGIGKRGLPVLALVLLLFIVPKEELRASEAGVATAHPLATKAGLTILAKGGNAFDAAVGVAAALGVVEPQSSGLGGGGFFLLHRASDGRELMLDAREKAPMAAHADMYLDSDGRSRPSASLNGPLAAGIPGLPAALVHLSAHYGRLPLADSLAPAIYYAENGFQADELFLRLANFRFKVLKESKAAAEIFLDRDQRPQAGFLLVQRELANTLRAIVEGGHAGFYQGAIAGRLVRGVVEAGGVWSSEDLANYQVVERAPIFLKYRGMKITSAALPSSGGVVIADVLNILSGYSLQEMSATDRVHLIVEAMRRAYRDRAVYMGDPDFVNVPVDRLTDLNYAAGQRTSIRLDRATPSSDLPGIEGGREGKDTTHFSIVDREGNRVAATLTVNYPFGSGFVVPGTGVLLNNEMDDFSSAPGVANVYGLIGSEANAISPGKRPLSSMSPSFLKKGSRIAVLGTPGGSRIISMVILAILDFAQGEGPESWVALPRYHHQYLPDEIQYEDGALENADPGDLKSRGHKLKRLARSYGNMQAVLVDSSSGRVDAAADPRGLGMACVMGVEDVVRCRGSGLIPGNLREASADAPYHRE